MCGRTCLTLEPNQVLCACKYKPTKNSQPHQLSNNNDEEKKSEQPEQIKSESSAEHSSTPDADAADSDFVIPEWRAEFNCGRTYKPSYNIAPTDITPVLVSTDHFGDEETSGEGGSTNSDQQQTRLVVPMMWGMIPFWHKGDYRRHGLTTNNCRLEHMLESKLYRGPFRRGQRCVVLCEGFYEWQTTKSAKPSERAAHFIYMPQAEGVVIYDKATWTPNNVRLLRLAALFDVWEDGNGDKMFSYSVITFEASNTLSWLHHRMPAILETEEQVNDWLDFKRVSDQKALATLRPATEIKWHRVSNLVNSSRQKSDDCNKPIELVKSQKKIKNKTMLAWLTTRKRREDNVSKTELSDEEIEAVGNGANSSSESEAENAVARPRFRDYKKAKKQKKNSTTSSTDGGGGEQPSLLASPTINCDESSSKSNENEKL